MAAQRSRGEKAVCKYNAYLGRSIFGCTRIELLCLSVCLCVRRPVGRVKRVPGQRVGNAAGMEQNYCCLRWSRLRAPLPLQLARCPHGCARMYPRRTRNTARRVKCSAWETRQEDMEYDAPHGSTLKEPAQTTKKRGSSLESGWRSYFHRSLKSEVPAKGLEILFPPTQGRDPLVTNYGTVGEL